MSSAWVKQGWWVGRTAPTTHIPHVQLEAVVHQGLDVEALGRHDTARGRGGGTHAGRQPGGEVGAGRCRGGFAPSGPWKAANPRRQTTPPPKVLNPQLQPVTCKKWREPGVAETPMGDRLPPTPRDRGGRPKRRTSTAASNCPPPRKMPPTTPHALCDVLVRHLLQDGGLARIVQTQHQNACLLLAWLQLAWPGQGGRCHG